MRAFKVNWGRADGKPWTEWDFPSSNFEIALKENTPRFTRIEGWREKGCYSTELDHPTLQIFIGKRVMCGIDKNYFLRIFKEGKGYEYIEDWKITHHLSMSKLSGLQILRITNMLREYGHANN